MITTERTVDELQATLYVVEGHLSPNILERLGMDMGDSASIASLTLFAFSFSAPQYPLDIIESISRELSIPLLWMRQSKRSFWRMCGFVKAQFLSIS